MKSRKEQQPARVPEAIPNTTKGALILSPESPLRAPSSVKDSSKPNISIAKVEETALFSLVDLSLTSTEDSSKNLLSHPSSTPSFEASPFSPILSPDAVDLLNNDTEIKGYKIGSKKKLGSATPSSPRERQSKSPKKLNRLPRLSLSGTSIISSPTRKSSGHVSSAESPPSNTSGLDSLPTRQKIIEFQEDAKTKRSISRRHSEANALNLNQNSTGTLGLANLLNRPRPSWSPKLASTDSFIKTSSSLFEFNFLKIKKLSQSSETFDTSTSDTKLELKGTGSLKKLSPSKWAPTLNTPRLVLTTVIFPASTEDKKDKAKERVANFVQSQACLSDLPVHMHDALLEAFPLKVLGMWLVHLPLNLDTSPSIRSKEDRRKSENAEELALSRSFTASSKLECWRIGQGSYSKRRGSDFTASPSCRVSGTRFKLSPHSKSGSLDNFLSPKGLRNAARPPPSPGSLPFSPRPSHALVETIIPETMGAAHEAPLSPSGMQPIGIGCLLKSGQILVFIDPAWRDQGYGYEVLKVLLGHGFSSECAFSEQNHGSSPELPYPEEPRIPFLWVQWTTEQNAGAAERLAEKLGMRRVEHNTWGLSSSEFEELWGDLSN